MKCGKTARCRAAIEAMLLDTNIVIYACQPGGAWLDPWTTHPDAALASVTRIEALGFAGISPEEEMSLLEFINACPAYPLDDEVIEQAIQLRQQKKMKLGDAIIAATAVAYNIPLVTRNEDDFNPIPPHMKRRSFLSLSALSAVPLAARAANAAPEPDWYDTVNHEGLKHRAVSDDGRITLQVELILPAEDEVTEAKDEKGEFRAYQYKGKDQPYPFHPGSRLLTRFDLTWDGKPMNLPERFWNDLPGLDLETSTLDPQTLAPDLQWKAKEFLKGLRQPRVSLSAEGGTVLIEWERPEECDSRSTIRWIVSKSGTVLRHRHCPPHEC